MFMFIFLFYFIINKSLHLLCNVHFKYCYIYQKRKVAIQGFSLIETRILIKIKNRKKNEFVLYSVHYWKI